MAAMAEAVTVVSSCKSEHWSRRGSTRGLLVPTYRRTGSADASPVVARANGRACQVRASLALAGKAALPGCSGPCCCHHTHTVSLLRRERAQQQRRRWRAQQRQRDSGGGRSSSSPKLQPAATDGAGADGGGLSRPLARSLALCADIDSGARQQQAAQIFPRHDLLTRRLRGIDDGV